MTTLTMESMPEGQKCAYPHCEKPATEIAAGRNYRPMGLPVGFYCQTHASVAADQGNPEYEDSCPNCGCRHGIN